MASPSLALPGVIFVGEDERARLVAHLGPAAGWMNPRGVLSWSTEVSVVARDALTEAIRRDAKIVMPEEQIAPAKTPLTHQAALKSPLVAVSGRLTQKLIDSGVRVHTIGADRVTSSFYYIAEGGGEPPARIEGDLVAAAGAMLGDKADNAAIDRVLDGLADRLLRSLSKDRIGELALELAAALPRASADGSGLNDVDVDAFEKELATLVGSSEKYTPFLQEIADKLAKSRDAKVDVPLFGDARKMALEACDLALGEQTVALGAQDRWIATGPLKEPAKAAPVAQKAASAPPPAKAASAPPPASAAPKSEPKATPKPEPKATPKPAEVKATPKPAEVKATPKPAEVKATPKPAEVKATPKPAEVKVEPTPAPAKAEPAKLVEPTPIVVVEAAKPEPVAAKAEPAKTEPAQVEPAKTEPVAAKAEPAKTEPVAAKAEPAKPEPVAAKAEPAKTQPVAAKAEPAKTQPAPKKEPASAAIERDVEDAIVKPKGGIPWLWILVLAAAAFAAYRIFAAQ